MADLLNSNELRVLGYLAAAIACWAAGRRERRFLQTSDLDLWPRFWSLTALVMLAMAIGRATDLANLFADLGRAEARSSGWYEARRPLQAALVGSVSLAWLVSVAVAVWRVPERRRRYLPEGVCVFSLICYAAIRTISFHYADAILYNNPIVGVRIGSIIELGLLSLALVAAFLPIAASRPRSARSMPITRLGADDAS